MKNIWLVRFSAFVAIMVVTIPGVILMLDPVAARDVTAGPLVHPAVGLLVYGVLSVGLYDWVVGHVGNVYRAAIMVAAPQFVLVNVDFVLSGKRGLMTAGASTVLMAATWTAVALLYVRIKRTN